MTGSTPGFFAEEHGGGSTGPPLVFVHGAGGNRLIWPPALRRMPGVHTFAVDLPGHGQSPPGPDSSIDGQARGLEAWHQSAGLAPAVVVGHSMGSAVALTLAEGAPERVAGLVLVGCGPSLRVNPALLEQTADHATFDVAVGNLLKWSFSPEAPARLIEVFRKRMIETGPDQLHADLLACDAFDLSDRLAEIEVETLILVGSRDRMTPLPLAQALQAGLPHARLEIVEGSGHMLMLETPERFAALLTTFVASLAVEP